MILAMIAAAAPDALDGAQREQRRRDRADGEQQAAGDEQQQRDQQRPRLPQRSAAAPQNGTGSAAPIT